MADSLVDQLGDLAEPAWMNPNERVVLRKAQIALRDINQLRSNVIATQNGSWSNLMYPLVAILNAADIPLIENVSDEQKRLHIECYGGAGGTPSNPKVKESR